MVVVAKDDNQAREIMEASKTSSDECFELGNTTDILTLDTPGVIADLDNDYAGDFYDMPIDER
jgi:hypothetical protein